MKELYAETSVGSMERPVGAKQNLRHIARNLYLNIAGIRKPDLTSCGTQSIYCHFVFKDQVIDFEKIILSLMKIGKFISSEQLEKNLLNREINSQPTFHLSFDDGLKNNIKYALPILEKYGIPATFFVPTNYIGASYDAAKEYCAKKTNYPRVLEMMDVSDLRLLTKLGYTIGSHTHSHERLSQINCDQKLRIEIAMSKKILEDQLGVECRYFSWPYGNMNAIDDASLQLVSNAEYKLCFGGFRGTISNDTNPLLLPRHHFEPNWPISHIQYFLRGNYDQAHN